METLTIEPTYRVLLGDVTRFRIMLVGCGGTGSSLPWLWPGWPIMPIKRASSSS